MKESLDPSIKVILPADRSREDEPSRHGGITKELADEFGVDEENMFHRLNRILPTETTV